MYPELNIFGFTLDSYRLFFYGGWVFVLIFSYFTLAKKGSSKRKILMMLMLSSIFSLIGARLFHFILYYNIYLDNPKLLYNLNLQGQAIIGGLLGAYASIYFYCRHYKINHLQILDNMAPIVGLGLIIGRVGCLLGGCCFGKETDSKLSIIFPLNSPAHRYQIMDNPMNIFESHSVYPTQIYEMIAGLFIFILGIVLLKKIKSDGIVVISVSLSYIIFRLINNSFRAPALTYSVPGWFYQSFYSLLVLILVLALYFNLKLKK